MNRRQMLSGLAGGGALALSGLPLALPGSVRAAEPVAAMTPFGFHPDFLEMMNAVSGGHFRRAGIDVQLLGGTGAAASLQQLLAGRVSFVRGTGIDTIKLVARGQPVVSIGTLYQSGYWFVMSSRDRPIASAEAMRGRTIGVVSVKGSTENYLDLMLNRVGVPLDAVKREVVGNSPGALALVQQGRIDAFIASGSVLAALRAQKAPVEAFDCDRYAPIPAQCYLTTRAVIERDPAQVSRFVQAIRASAEELLGADFFSVLDRAARDFEITGLKNREELAIAHDIVRQSWLAAGRPNLMRNMPAAWRTASQALVAAGLAPAHDADRAFTNTFLDRRA
jgi:ABC-type nitrate/sulfonate/bicarbonate transport system substrate-binding protein